MNEELNAEDRTDLVAGLFDRIDHLNCLIAQRQTDADADPLAVEEFTARRHKYIGQLALLLNQYGVIVQLPAAPDQTGRAA